MSDHNSRLKRESKTLNTMISMHCQDKHKTSGKLCSDCEELFEYAGKRLDNCPFQAGKTTCNQCSTHCYKPEMREKIRIVMQYAGPRIIYRHPLLLFYYFIDGIRKRPLKTMKNKLSEEKLCV